MPTADISALYQIIGYIVLFIIMQQFLFKPLLKVMKEREEKTSGALKKASDIEKEISDGLAEYDRKIRDAAAKGHEEIKRLKAAWAEKEKAMLDAARTEAGKEIAESRKSVQKDKQNALDSLKAETKALSKNIAEKLIERNVTTLLPVVFAVLLIPGLALASEGGSGHGVFNKEFLWKSINFTVLIVALAVIWKKAIKGVLAKKSTDIKKALEDAKDAKDAAEKKAVEYAEKLKLLEVRVAEIQEAMKREAESESMRLMKETEQATIKIREQARLAAEQELGRARLEIRREVASIAAQMAEEILRKELRPEDQERLIRANLKNLRLN